MFNQMNYQICPYHINKITNYEKSNYSPPLNLKNIQTMWRIIIPLYSPPLYLSQQNYTNIHLEGEEYKKENLKHYNWKGQTKEVSFTGNGFAGWWWQQASEVSQRKKGHEK